MDKIILDLCGGTGAWSKPYKDAGYDVRLITLPEYDVRTYNPPEHVYGVLAAPPCVMFSIARNHVRTPRDFYVGMELVEACLSIIWRIRKKEPLKFWALENPCGYLRQFLGKPPFVFTPSDFGDRYTKKTDIWGYYNIPKKRPIDSTLEPRCLPSLTNLVRDPIKRAITPPGFALAFFKANR